MFLKQITFWIKVLGMKRLLKILVVGLVALCGCKNKNFVDVDWYIIYTKHYNERCKEFKENIEGAKNCDVVFLGDSITEGYPLHIFFNEYKVVNRGINGDTTNGVINRLDFSVYDLNPKIVYLMIGTNNYQTCMSNYEDILKGIKEHNPDTKVIVMSIIPRAGDEATAKIRENNVEIEKLAGIYGYFYVNAFTAMTVNNENLTVNNDLFVDGLHPNMDGYTILTNTFKPTIVEWLK